MKLGIYPGSFDPVTLGHLDIIERASQLFDRVLVTVTYNPRKTGALFTPEERVVLLRRVVKGFPNVEVEQWDGLLAEYAAQKGAAALVKGLRAMSDFELEFQMALINRKLNPALDTLFLTTNERYLYLSSSMVKEVGRLGGPIGEFVPADVLADILAKLGRPHGENP